MHAVVAGLLGRVPEVARAHNEQTEAERALAPAVVEALVEAGLFRLGVPPGLGGVDPDAFEVLDVLEALTDADASVAWCVWNNLLPALLGRQLDAEARRELFGAPTAVFGNSTRAQGRAVRDGGGYRVSGRWGLVSGSPAATQFMLLCTVHDRDGDDTRSGTSRFVYLPRESVEIIDTWTTSGLCGTGSHDVVAEGVRVEHRHTCTYLGTARSAAGGLDRLPIMAFMAAGAATMLLGLARRCVQELVTTATVATVTDGRAQAAARPPVAIGVARADADLAAARAAVRGSLGALIGSIDAEQVADDHFAALYQSIDLARRNALRTVRSCHELAGTAAVYRRSPLERAHRDALVMVQHIMFDPMWAEQAGRVHLGLAPTNPLFNH